MSPLPTKKMLGKMPRSDVMEAITAIATLRILLFRVQNDQRAHKKHKQQNTKIQTLHNKNDDESKQ